jgi:hypothetical protein
MTPPHLLISLWIHHLPTIKHDHSMHFPSLLSSHINHSCLESMFKPLSHLLSNGCGMVMPAIDRIDRINNHHHEWVMCNMGLVFMTFIPSVQLGVFDSHYNSVGISSGISKPLQPPCCLWFFSIVHPLVPCFSQSHGAAREG